MTKLSKNRPEKEILKDKYDQLVITASELGYTVVRGKSDQAFTYEKKITINTKQTIFNQIISLAHEIGHLLTLDWCIAQFGDRVLSGPPGYWPALESELMAWNAADWLLQRLNLYGPKYIKQKHICLRTYYRETYKHTPKNLS